MHTVILVISLNKIMNINPEVQNLTQRPHLLSRKNELGQIAEVLTNSPENLAGIDIRLVPLQKLLRRSDILCDGFLG
jgi:hypothetical protein